MAKKRLIWVDVAKTIAIILMVAGHELPQGPFRVWVFSFHMPLFFILSGYTSHRVRDWADFWNTARKLFLKIWLLACIITFLFHLESWIISGYHDTYEQLFSSFIGAVFWGSGVPFGNHPTAGVMWFLFVFFWAKLFFDLLNLVFKRRVIFFAIIFAFVAYLISTRFWLPQSLDIVPIASLFMAVGGELRGRAILESNWTFLIAIVSVILWLTCVQNGLYIELATRHYPQFTWSIMAAVGGSIVTFLCSMALTRSYQLRWLQLIGRHTLAIMCIHQLDLFWQNFQFMLPHKSVILIIFRLLLDFGLFFVYILFLKLLNAKRQG